MSDGVVLSDEDGGDDDMRGLSKALRDERRFMRIEADVRDLRTWARAHNKQCADNNKTLLQIVLGGGGSVAMLLLGILGWALGQLHGDQAKQIDLMRQALDKASEIPRVITVPIPQADQPVMSARR